jgi:hypothetical protein
MDFAGNSLRFSMNIYTIGSDNRGKGYSHPKTASSRKLADLLEIDLVQRERKLGTILDFSRDYNFYIY